LAYSRAIANGNLAIHLYDTGNGQLHQATSGYYTDWHPSFDPDGQYLYFSTTRNFEPMYGDFDNSWTYPNSQQIVAAALRSDVPSPLPPRNDEEKGDDEEENGTDNGEGENGNDEGENGNDDNSNGPEPVEIEIDGLEERIVILPVEAGNYDIPEGAKGKVVYFRGARTGSIEDTPSPILYYDFKEREEKTIVGDADGFVLSADGKKLLVWKDESAAIVKLAADQKMDKPLRFAEMEMLVDPRAEWRLLFNDAWRFQRDFFYDPGMHGVDWDAMRDQYGALIDDAVTRWDVNYVIGELIGELNASHSYRGGGDTEAGERRGVGLLGVNWTLVDGAGNEVEGRGLPTGQGAYRIDEIVRGAAWDAELRSPLAVPGVDVSEGDYVLAVNGNPVDTSKDPWASFQGVAGETVILTVNDRPTMTGARQVVVETLDSETRLRHLAWIESQRQRVDDETDGRVGYIYVRDTGRGGQSELYRQYAAQWNKPALIIDERFNSGGQIAQLLGGPRPAAVPEPAERPQRPQGHADQRLERIGRRPLSAVLQAGGTRAAGWDANLGRPDRDQWRAADGGWRSCHGADVSHVPSRRHLVQRGPAWIPTSKSPRAPPSWLVESTRSSRPPSTSPFASSR
jgi:tricorn protease